MCLGVPAPDVSACVLFFTLVRVFLTGLSPILFADYVGNGKTTPGLVFAIVITRDLLCMLQALFIVCISFIYFNRYPLDSIVIVFID
jgi:hypothetical protein